MNIIIINTACGNLYSLQSAIKKIGFNALITNNPNKIRQADKIFLPGVGSVKSAMNTLQKYNLIQMIFSCKKDILGICLGMQILGKYSMESNGIHTLNILDYDVNIINNTNLPVPHMGWNTINYSKFSPILYNIPDQTYFYFSHSYIINTNQYTIATSHYHKFFSAIIQYKNFFGVQFHPEKSGMAGLQLIKNFLKI
ncbi:imidazole glycerol phosphate synthase subunit HisH [Enterobacteriaceae endosymbiont of Macroplea mutica]|uniref:imidazole glycerol phosphate synthase subunit HisH n=1 Tax=Enterobacteriaceae endosymbiont of Macroplea mutica TaxID=2675791 RepID=UPI0014493A30|nr:imidazole glycerol phosphate synthase subunit HisH [Enterobacteriaceae endosymbiont of Macroplea mutica]QJC31162.1 imidazole glycerol phosphate synthase subunit HisH [Enterobacteriaceae endosymbiont of Macroplea mutica]